MAIGEKRHGLDRRGIQGDRHVRKFKSGVVERG